MLMVCLLALMLHNNRLAGVEPLVLVDGGGAVRLGLPEAVLEDREVLAHLKTGLTTSFVHTVSLQGADGERNVGRMLVDVYFEPWDESWQVTTRGRDGEHTTHFADYAGFVQWWRRADLPLMHLAQGSRVVGDVQVTVDVIPFSAAEQQKAQRWFVQSAHGQAPAQVSGAGVDKLLGTPTLFDMFLATSIKRHSLQTFRWKVPPRAP